LLLPFCRVATIALSFDAEGEGVLLEHPVRSPIEARNGGTGLSVVRCEVKGKVDAACWVREAMICGINVCCCTWRVRFDMMLSDGGFNFTKA
jgi:hypothetical protein